MLAPLNELKAGYVEVVNPLLSRQMVELARHLPDSARSVKRLFKQVVREHGPDLPFASRAAVESRAHIIRSPAVRTVLMAELAKGGDTVLPRELLTLLRSRLDSPADGRAERAGRSQGGLRELVRTMLPASGLATLKNHYWRFAGPRAEQWTDWPLLESSPTRPVWLLRP